MIEATNAGEARTTEETLRRKNDSACAVCGRRRADGFEAQLRANICRKCAEV